VITRGRRGIHIATKDSSYNSEAEPLRKDLKYNKNGAGDAVFSAVIYEYANKMFNPHDTGIMAAHMAKKVMCSGSPSIDRKLDYKSTRKEMIAY
jgi:sugar/nucleoside kinase (ribokinase family)